MLVTNKRRFSHNIFKSLLSLVVKSRDCMGKVQLGVFCQYKDRCLNGTINSVADFIKINTFIEMERIIDILQGHGCNACNVPLSHASGTQKKWCKNVSIYSRAELAASVETSAKTTTTGSVINKHFWHYSWSYSPEFSKFESNTPSELDKLFCLATY